MIYPRVVSVENLPAGDLTVGQIIEIDVGQVAHGGHFIARYQGRVIFVRQAITGERVSVLIEEVSKKVVRASAIAVIKPSPHRKDPECSYFLDRRCGGCDFLHIDLNYQRELKAQVLKDSFKRIAQIDIDPICHSASVDESGLGWRSRMDFTISANKKIALHAPRSHDLTEIKSCLIASPAIDIAKINSEVLKKENPPTGSRLRVSADRDGNLQTYSQSKRDLKRAISLISMKAGGKEFLISPDSFWQPHHRAADLLQERVIQLLQPQVSEHILDLYGGVGLFTAFIKDFVGATGRVTLIESHPSAAADARRIFAEDLNVVVMEMEVLRALKKLKAADQVVIDPPRSGAGASVISELLRLQPKRIIYISCDPATLARDAKALIEGGYRLAQVDGYDLFPMTEHIESVAEFILDGAFALR
jgi:tRNA/tmRNA/rRNA uracil-C5-methylase (TrmA/RlmC/RlmD family)